MSPTYIGIDPGFSGAIAVIHPQVRHRYVVDLPVIETKVGRRTLREYDIEQLHGILAGEIGSPLPEPVVTLEHVTRPAKLTRCQGILEGLLVALYQPYTLVRPQAWKRDLGLPTGAGKAASLALARDLFPELADRLTRAKDDGRAEALLIAEWGRRQA